MFKAIKINTAVLICTAFIFRLLFVNIGLISTLNNNQHNGNIKRHFASIIKKRRKQFDPITSCKNFGYSTVEALEEDSNDEELFKSNFLPLLFLFYSKIENEINAILKKITSFNKHFSYSSSYRYVEYRVFRI